jgi:integrase/recombinase XerC
MAWCERTWQNSDPETVFSPERVATPTVTRYRDYLQCDLDRKPNTVNRNLMSIKRFFSCITDAGLISRDPARPVELVAQASRPPRHLSDTVEETLITAVIRGGNLRDLTLITVMLHTGLRIS